MQVSQTIFRITLIIGTAIGALAFNMFFLDRSFIPAPCYYHTHNGGRLFHLFYDLQANEGYHPVPSIFNIVFTAVLGGLTGYGIFNLILRKKKTKTA